MDNPDNKGKNKSKVLRIDELWSDLGDFEEAYPQEEINVDLGLPETPDDDDEFVLPNRLAMDLSGRTKVIMPVARGNCGKTLACRVIGESGVDAGRAPILAACDIGNRTLAKYFEGVKQPKSKDPELVQNFVINAIQYTSKTETNAIIDLGAGGEAILIGIDKRLGLLNFFEEMNVVPVVLTIIATGIDDVSSMANLLKCNLLPPATAILFNEGLMGKGSTRQNFFGPIRRHPSMIEAVRRGAVQLALPAMDRQVMGKIERKRLLFGDAAAGRSGQATGAEPLGLIERLITKQWLDRVLRELGLIQSWLT